MAAATVLTGWQEGARLIANGLAHGWDDVLRVIHGDIGFACGFGAVAALVGVVVLAANPRAPKM